MSADEQSNQLNLLQVIVEGSAHKTSVAPGLGYPNHFEDLSPNPTGWLNKQKETFVVSRETIQPTNPELRGSN